MFKALKWLIKATLFALIVLVLGNLIQIKGKTVSDQIKTQISHAERSESASKMRGWTEDLINTKQLSIPAIPSHQNSKGHSQILMNHAEEISISERQKLKELIRELNQ